MWGDPSPLHSHAGTQTCLQGFLRSNACSRAYACTKSPHLLACALALTGVCCRQPPAYDTDHTLAALTCNPGCHEHLYLVAAMIAAPAAYMAAMIAAPTAYMAAMIAAPAAHMAAIESHGLAAI